MEVSATSKNHGASQRRVTCGHLDAVSVTSFLLEPCPQTKRLLPSSCFCSTEQKSSIVLSKHTPGILDPLNISKWLVMESRPASLAGTNIWLHEGSMSCWFQLKETWHRSHHHLSSWFFHDNLEQAALLLLVLPSLCQSVGNFLKCYLICIPFFKKHYLFIWLHWDLCCSMWTLCSLWNLGPWTEIKLRPLASTRAWNLITGPRGKFPFPSFHLTELWPEH